MKTKLSILFFLAVSSFGIVSAADYDSLDINSITITAKKEIAESPVFKTKNLDTAIIGHIYSCKVNAEAKDSQLEIEATGLPYGLTINKEGKITGKPYLDGVYKVYLVAKTKYHQTIKGYDLVVDVEKHHRKYYYLEKNLDVFPNRFEETINAEYNLPEQYMVNIEIFDKKGNKVKTVAENQVQEGNNSFAWDGLTENGKKAKDGFYSVVFQLTDMNDNKYTIERRILRSHVDPRHAFYVY